MKSQTCTLSQQYNAQLTLLLLQMQVYKILVAYPL